MPRPPILPTVNWQDVYNSGIEYSDWLPSGESPDNQQRMDDDRKTFTLAAHTKAMLAGLDRTVYVIAIAEDWCGDVVRHVPVLQAMADVSDNLHVRYITRDQYPDVFARYLTNGGEAIPKFVFFSDNWIECGNWGPMPESTRELIARGKAAGNVGVARQKVNLAYEADSTRRQVVAELARLIDIASTTDV